MTYACPVWTLTKKMNIGLISILQRKCLRIINFAPFNSYTNDMLATDKILKFEDIISFEQLKVVFDKLNTLPDELNNLFQFNCEVSNYNTRNASKEGLYIPQIQTTNHGKLSLKYSALVLWNAFIKSNCSITSFKRIRPFQIFFKIFLYFVLLNCLH